MNRKERRAAARTNGRTPGPRRPPPIEFLYEQAVRELRIGHNSAATKLLGQVIVSDPRHLGALNHLGALGLKTGDGESARFFFLRILEMLPRTASAHFNLGLAHRLMQDLEQAECAFRNAIAIDPRVAEAHVALADTLHARERLSEAVESLNTALAIRPGYAEAHMNLGNLLRELHRLSEATACGERAVRLLPDSALAHRNLAVTLQEQGLAEAALKHFERALSLDPNFTEAQSGRLFCLNYEPSVPAAMITEEHRRWGAACAARNPAVVTFERRREDEERILRIGYLSNEFHRHPVGYFLSRVLETHSRSAIEVFCYSNGARKDSTTLRFIEAAQNWRDIHGSSDDSVEALIRADRIDILVDLSGHVASNRLPLFARRPAPVQASWLGYVATTGLPALDYVIMDAITVPVGSDSLFTESVLRLPHGRFCYAPPSYAPAPAVPPSTMGNPVTFGSFNHVLKIGPGVVKVWAAVLQAVPGSRLRLKWMSLADESVRSRLRDSFGAEGISPDRLEFSAYSPHAAMLEEYGDVDVVLDPFPFSGGLTTCEALWMGVPVVTLPMERAASRQSSAFLSAVGLFDLVATSDREYVSIAASLAANPSRLKRLRTSLRSTMAASPLCDAAIFTPSLELAFRGMWRRFCRGEPAAAFDIPGV